MNENMGLGKVVEKQILPYTTPYQPLSITLHQNNKDYWLVFINKNQKLNALLIDSTGVSSTPVVSELGSAFPQLAPYRNYGRLLFSHSMDYMVITIYDELFHSEKTPICFYSFNRETGKVQYLWKIEHEINSIMGIEFSPNDKYLYVSGNKVNEGIYQIKLNDDKTIVPSTIAKILSDGALDMQLAPDGKIYFISDHFNLGVINNPNLEGTLCDVENNKLSLHGKIVNFYFPHFVKRLLNVFSYNINCNVVEFVFTYSQSQHWNFGDGNTSSEQNPTHTYAAAGTYTVSLTATYTDGTTQTANKTRHKDTIKKNIVFFIFLIKLKLYD